eukprot:1985933-Rhodomonas_salina.1
MHAVLLDLDLSKLCKPVLGWHVVEVAAHEAASFVASVVAGLAPSSRVFEGSWSIDVGYVAPEWTQRSWAGPSGPIGA